MNNYHAIETELEFRRREWQRAVEADARAAQVCAENGRKHVARLSLPNVRSFLAPRLSVFSPLGTRRRSVAC